MRGNGVSFMKHRKQSLMNPFMDHISPMNKELPALSMSALALSGLSLSALFWSDLSQTVFPADVERGGLPEIFRGRQL